MSVSAQHMLSGIEDVAQFLSNNSSNIERYTDLPDATENDGKIVDIGCDLYYSCNGEWKKVGGADSADPPDGVEIPDCVSNLEEYTQYQDYVDNVINSNIDVAFDIGFRNLTVDDFFNNVCLFANNLNVPQDLDVVTEAPSINEVLDSHGVNNHYPQAGSYDVLWAVGGWLNDPIRLYVNGVNANGQQALFDATIKYSTSVSNKIDFWHEGGGNMGWVLPEEYTYVKTGQKFRISMWSGADRESGTSWSTVGHPSHPSSWTTDYIANVSSNEEGEITVQYSFSKLVSPAPNWHQANITLVAVFNYGTEYASWYRIAISTYTNNANTAANVSDTSTLDFPLWGSPANTPIRAPFEGLGSVLVTESNYKWALVPKDNPTVNIEADPGDCQFIGWQTSNSSILGNANDASTTALINQETSITGVFDCTV